jgi:hypothetical protein
MARGASGGIMGFLHSLIVLILKYGYIPLEWILKRKQEKQAFEIACKKFV